LILPSSATLLTLAANRQGLAGIKGKTRSRHKYSEVSVRERERERERHGRRNKDGERANPRQCNYIPFSEDLQN
jgi:hypothetical protein